MTRVFGRNVRFFLFLVLCCIGTTIAGVQALGSGNDLSSVDPYSEANVLREVDGFRVQGLWHDTGLGNVLFGHRYAGYGFKGDRPEVLERSVTDTGVYTHYPPGPEYILFVAQQALGFEPVSRLRIVPLVLCGLAALYFGLNVRRRFGEAAAWLTMLASLAAVPFYSGNGSIHCLGYAQALLLAEMGFCLGNSHLRAPALLLGFLQGWISFDFFFEVALVPLLVECALPWITPSSRPRYRLALWRCVLAAAGFAVAHAMHLAQVAIFYGSVSDALGDLSGAAAYRNGMGHMQSWADYLQTVAALFVLHFVSLDPVRLPLLSDLGSLFAGGMGDQVEAVHTYRVFGLTLAPFWLAIAVAFLSMDHQRKRLGRSPALLFRRWALVGLAGAVVSSLWWVLMPSHAAAHLHLHYRHLNVCFALWVIFLAVQAAVPVERWATSRSRPLGMPLAVGN